MGRQTPNCQNESCLLKMSVVNNSILAIVVIIIFVFIYIAKWGQTVNIKGLAMVISAALVTYGACWYGLRRYIASRNQIPLRSNPAYDGPPRGRTDESGISKFGP